MKGRIKQQRKDESKQIADIYAVQDRLARLIGFSDYMEYKHIMSDMEDAMLTAKFIRSNNTEDYKVQGRLTFGKIKRVKQDRWGIINPDLARVDVLAIESGLDRRLLHAAYNKVKNVRKLRAIVYADDVKKDDRLLLVSPTDDYWQGILATIKDTLEDGQVIGVDDLKAFFAKSKPLQVDKVAKFAWHLNLMVEAGVLSRNWQSIMGSHGLIVHGGKVLTRRLINGYVGKWKP